MPVKAADKERLGESEEVFEYMIVCICPLLGEYEPGKPEWGFLFPAFTDRSGDLDYISIYRESAHNPEEDFFRRILGLEKA